MGRWSSPLVIEYSGVSMTGEITSETARAMGSTPPTKCRTVAAQDPTVRSTLRKVEDQLGKHIELAQTLEGRIKSLEDVKPKSERQLIVVNNSTGVHHRSVGEIGVQSHAYHTLCGIDYTCWSPPRPTRGRFVDDAYLSNVAKRRFDR